MKIVVLDRGALGTDTPLEELSSFGEVEVYDTSTEAEAIVRVCNAEVIITNKVKINKAVISAAKNLKLICVFATGYDNIDVNYAKEQGVAVCNVPGYSTESVVLFTLATVLSLVTNLREYNDYVRSGAYTESGIANRLTPVYHELRGMTWGIVGCGNIGGAVARVAKALGANVIVNKRTPTDEFVCVDIDTLCRESDIITLHCPLNDGTRNLINRERIAAMKQNAILVNEARGAVVDDEAITEAILGEMISGFGSDVFTTEPFGKDHPFYRIKDLRNVLLTPHAAWGAYEARARCMSIICDNIRSFINGETLNRIDK